jgi:hypothetical protein
MFYKQNLSWLILLSNLKIFKFKIFFENEWNELKFDGWFIIYIRYAE